jgi:hypothetical protein
MSSKRLLTVKFQQKTRQYGGFLRLIPYFELFLNLRYQVPKKLTLLLIQ